MQAEVKEVAVELPSQSPEPGDTKLEDTVFVVVNSDFDCDHYD